MDNRNSPKPSRMTAAALALATLLAHGAKAQRGDRPCDLGDPLLAYDVRGWDSSVEVKEKSHGTTTKHWNQFRGPRGDGKSHAESLPVEFSETKNVRWKTAIPGKGWSSPVVWDKQIWLTTGREDGTELFAVCVDLGNGDIVHDLKVFDVADPSMKWSEFNPHATPTPVVEEGRVCVHHGSYGTACLDTKSGDVIWRRQDLRCNHRVGPGSSPITSDDSLFPQFDGVDVQYVVALNKATGKILWKKKREVDSGLATKLRNSGLSESDIEETKIEKPGDNRKSYATPTLIEYRGQRQLIRPGTEVLFSYDPKTGDELWQVQYPGWGWNVAFRPILAHGLVYCTAGISHYLFAIRPDGRGDVTDTHVVWSTKGSVPNLSSPVIVGDLLFMVTDKGGIVSCLDARTGEQIWRRRLGSRGDHWASPVVAGGKIYFSSTRGHVTVIAVAREFQRLADNKLNASFIASPAVAGDALILRSTTHLYHVAEGLSRKEESQH